LTLGMALASCAPSIAPRGVENDSPAVLSTAFLTRDGLRLPLRHWDAKDPQAVIVALHGMSDYSNAFDMPADFWAKHGITTFAYDQRGFGGSPNTGLWPGSEALRSDLSDFVDVVHREFPALPVFALGESMGGAVVLSALAGENPPRVSGAILVAPAVWSRGDMPLSYRVALWTAVHVAPGMKLSGRGLNIWPSDNIPMLRKLARDPLFQHSTRTDAVYGLANLMDQGRHAAGELRSAPPILWLYGRNDQIIPPASTEAALRLLTSPADIRCYARGYHMLLRDLEGPTVWKDVLDWVQSQKARAASADAGSSKVAAQLDAKEGRGQNGRAVGGEGQTAELASSPTDLCPDASDKREIVTQRAGR
jgi:alpha-beta hydrolase superfamily lysophospholipase